MNMEQMRLLFTKQNLLESALTHRSYYNESRYDYRIESLGHNERLEFLGDTLLSTIVGEYLYLQFPYETEGDLSKRRAQVVNEGALALIAKSIDLGSSLKIGKGEIVSGGIERPRILASAFEALIGALFLDQGYEITKKWVLSLMVPYMIGEPAEAIKDLDFKTKLQEYLQGKKRPLPIYMMKGENGPSHDRIFETEISVEGFLLGSGIGKSKKQSEQAAAKTVYLYLSQQEVGK